MVLSEDVRNRKRDDLIVVPVFSADSEDRLQFVDGGDLGIVEGQKRHLVVKHPAVSIRREVLALWG